MRPSLFSSSLAGPTRCVSNWKLLTCLRFPSNLTGKQQRVLQLWNVQPFGAIASFAMAPFVKRWLSSIKAVWPSATTASWPLRSTRFETEGRPPLLVWSSTFVKCLVSCCATPALRLVFWPTLSCVAFETPSGVEGNFLFCSWIYPSSLAVVSSCFTFLLKAHTAATFHLYCLIASEVLSL